MNAEPRLFRRLDSVVLESIFWDERTEEVAWLDIPAGTFHRARLDGAVDGSDDRVTRLPAPVSAVQPAVGGGYVAALKDRIVELYADGTLGRTLAHVRHAHRESRFNEGKVDPFGRFVVGSMDGGGNPDAAVYIFTADGHAAMLRGGFTITNGMEWSDAGDVMYVTDTTTQTVHRAPYGPGEEPLGDLEPYLRGRASDGIAMDTTGSFWNGIYGDGEVVQWSAGGEAVGSIAIPAPHVTSVAFGGPGHRTLFVGTARENMSDEDLAAAPLSGSLFAVDGVAQGRPVHTFGSGGGRR
jgi:sugar lactone lactonase YvrE